MRRSVWILLALTAPSLAHPENAPPPRPLPPSQPPHNAPPPPTATCLGRWQGWGRGGSGSPWSIDLNVASPNGQCGTIEYPSLGCGGYLTQCVVSGGRLHAVEVYTHNPGTCAPAGVIDAECAAGVMQWVWRGEELVRSVLHRI